MHQRVGSKREISRHSLVKVPWSMHWFTWQQASWTCDTAALTQHLVLTCSFAIIAKSDGSVITCDDVHGCWSSCTQDTHWVIACHVEVPDPPMRPKPIHWISIFMYLCPPSAPALSLWHSSVQATVLFPCHVCLEWDAKAVVTCCRVRKFGCTLKVEGLLFRMEGHTKHSMHYNVHACFMSPNTLVCPCSWLLQTHC